MKEYKTNNAVGKPYGCCHIRNRGTELEYKDGHYTFAHGVVRFYAEPTFASFDFVFKGRIFGLSLSDLPAMLTDRQLIRRAGAFGREIVSQENKTAARDNLFKPVKPRNHAL